MIILKQGVTFGRKEGGYMDLVKIGKYIAGKRKALGLTQVQVAEKLGMSDKSVSKWERGICLPDVSVYMELCGILGISLNEFIAGEDLPQEKIIPQSEENLMEVAKDGRTRQKKLRRMIAVLLCLLLAAALFFLLFINRDSGSYVEPLAKDSAEMEMAQFLSGADGACLYKYRLDATFTEIGVTLSVYHRGLLQKTEALGSMKIAPQTTWEGMAALLPDYENFKIKVILTGDGARYMTEFPILEKVSGRETYGRSVVEMEGRTRLSPNGTEEIAAFIYSRDGLQAGSIKDIANGAEWMRKDEAVYVLALHFR